jgi:hypothetical protein
MGGDTICQHPENPNCPDDKNPFYDPREAFDDGTAPNSQEKDSSSDLSVA